MFTLQIPCSSGFEVMQFFSMLNVAEHEIYLAHECENANNCWYFNICQQDLLLVLMVKHGSSKFDFLNMNSFMS